VNQSQLVGSASFVEVPFVQRILTFAVIEKVISKRKA